MKSILMVGVGGQGTILASKLLTQGLLAEGYNIKMSEIHGMSQRGGSVVTHIRFGKEEVYSPVIGKGKADIIIAFEKMEAIRYLGHLSANGTIVVNDLEIPSISISTGETEYPSEIIEEIQKNAKTIVINAAEIAEKIGNQKVTNMVMLGAVIGKMGLDSIDWKKLLIENIKPEFVEMNMKAINAGIELVK
ncbi:MAG TPA: indolepyruvate oxidoreductase subunit beta [Clostridia bacterium]|nr:indolepyruvate oxidoreductase subunit beta [Clostridia bacterium]